MPPDKFRVALVQMSCGPDPEQNLQKALERVSDAAGRGAQVVCLPELFQTQYFCQREDHSLFDLAEPIPGPSSEKLAAAARQHGVVLIASLFEKRAPGVYHNTAAIFDSNGSLSGLYRKMHIPDDPLYYEKFYFTPGDLGFRALDTTVGRLGTLVCWDQWFPEGARLTALQGASVLFYPTAIGWHPSEKAEFGASPARRLAHHSARPRHRQRSLRSSSQSRRLRNRQHPRQVHPRPRTGILGRIVFLRSLRPRPRRSLTRPRRNPDGRRRPESPRRHPPQLALPPRPQNRRLRPHRQSHARRRIKSGQRDQSRL